MLEANGPCSVLHSTWSLGGVLCAWLRCQEEFRHEPDSHLQKPGPLRADSGWTWRSTAGPHSHTDGQHDQGTTKPIHLPLLLLGSWKRTMGLSKPHVLSPWSFAQRSGSEVRSGCSRLVEEPVSPDTGWHSIQLWLYSCTCGSCNNCMSLATLTSKWPTAPS